MDTALEAYRAPAKLQVLTPTSLPEAMQMARMLADSTLVPKDYIGKPGNVLVAMQWGAELGLAPLQAMQNIAVINGRPSIWGDAMLALCMASPVFEDIKETIEGEGENAVAICTVRRKGMPSPVTATFSVADAKAAGLWGQAGPWTQYKLRMLKFRARGFALRDTFADVLRGMISAEEARDIPADPMRDVTPHLATATSAPKAPEDWPGNADAPARPVVEPFIVEFSDGPRDYPRNGRGARSLLDDLQREPAAALGCMGLLTEIAAVLPSKRDDIERIRAAAAQAPLPPADEDDGWPGPK